MPRFRNVSGKDLSILVSGRRIMIPKGCIVEGPDFFRNYKALKQVSDLEYSQHAAHMPKFIKANPMDRLRSFITPNSNSSEYAIRVDKKTVLATNIKNTVDAIDYVSQYSTTGTPPVYIYLEGEYQEDKKKKIKDISQYKNIVFLDNMQEADLPSVTGDIVLKIKEGVFEFDFVSLIAKYCLNNVIKLPKPFVLEEINKQYIVSNIIKYKKSNEKVDITIATLTHNKQQYITFLEDLSKQQTAFKFEVISIPNFNGEFTSCAEPLNIALDLANGYVVNLCHQDLRVNTAWLEGILFHVDTLDKSGIKWGILGMAGAFKYSRAVTPETDGNILYLADMTPSKLSYAAIYRQMYGSKKEVQTVDELSLIMRRDSPFRFDNVTCDHFHFYGADICLNALSQGYKNFAIDADCLHLSDGQGNLTGGHVQAFIDSSIKLFKKWSKTFPYFKSTTAVFFSKENTIIPAIFMIINKKRNNKDLPETIKVT